MRILLIGSGGRENALAYALKNSDKGIELFASPGNPGIFKYATNANFDYNSYRDLISFCKNQAIDLVVIGPEQPIADGISDILLNEHINCFAPSQKAGMLETSKGFAKNFMKKYGIPTADFRIFAKGEFEEAIRFLRELEPPYVIKADGLAGGKGVVLASDIEEAQRTVQEIFQGKFKEAGSKIVIEEFCPGQEASILAICDGNDYFILPSSQDHKRVFDNDEGKNTGGMGAYAPVPFVNEELLLKIERTIIKPTIEGMQREGTPFVGCLYAGLMINNDEAKVIEFNIRFGDPEAQAVLLLIEGNFAQLLYSSAVRRIEKEVVRVNNLYSCCVVLASQGYPDTYQTGFEINGLESAEKQGAIIFHSGTKEVNGKYFTNGGRVLSVCGMADTLESAIKQTYEYVNLIHFSNMHYRKDIGRKGIDVRHLGGVRHLNK